ncbi:MAG TPA: hypothetical protein VF098_04765 [Sphingomicrobium sp.]|jgi:hypothetical protein
MIGSLLLAAAAAATSPQQAAPAIAGSSLVKAVQNCQSIADNAARLACYDRAAAALVTATNRGDVAIVDREQVRETRRSLFGFSLPRIALFGNSKMSSADQEPKQIDSTLSSFHPLANGFFQFTLTEPQSTWESTEGSSVFEPKAGAKVTIEHGALGSYYAEIGGQQWVHVRRVH